jgi:predicted nucleic acid-binding protein
MFLIDTSIWIEFLRPGGSPRAKSRVKELLEAGIVATCGVVAVELLRGAKTKSQFDALSDALLALPQLPLDDETVSRAAAWGFELDRKGAVVPTTDLLIASAGYGKAKLLHADHDFQRIAAVFDLAEEMI